MILSRTVWFRLDLTLEGEHFDCVCNPLDLGWLEERKAVRERNTLGCDDCGDVDFPRKRLACHVSHTSENLDLREGAVLGPFDDDEVTVDFNHPLAGRTVLFDVLVHRVEPAELH